MHRVRQLICKTMRLGVCVALATAALPPVAARGAEPSRYVYWLAHAQSKVLPTSPAPASASTPEATATAIVMTAAIGEAEGRQLVLRSGEMALQDIWLEPAELVSVNASGIAASIPATAVASFKVHYVRISKPSYGSSYTGLVPDPLLPMTLENGQRLGWEPDGAENLTRRGVAANTTQPFYIRVSVPDNAAPGVYLGTISLTGRTADGASLPLVDLPLQVTVYPFSIAKRTLKTSFGLHMGWAAYANSASNKWLSPSTTPSLTRVLESTSFKGEQMGRWLKFMSDYRVSPQAMLPAWENGSNWAPPADDGRMVARKDYLDDFLATGNATTFSGSRFAFNTVKMPEYGAPSAVLDPFRSKSARAKAARYYSTMRSQLGSYASRAMAYPLDEPTRAQRSFVEQYADFVHKYAPGVPFFVTTDPVTMQYKPLRSVDSYGQRLHFYFRDYSAWVKPLRKSGKTVWIYSHATSWQSSIPNYLLDEALPESRSQGWFAWRTRASGLLYFSINAWRYDTGSRGYRDPYTSTISFESTYRGRPMYANGDGSLVYPGYYPDLGLYVQGSGPVSSLRMEALRDGLEDYEYVRAVANRYGTAVADAYCSRIISPLPAKRSGRLWFPAYKKTSSDYDGVRRSMAAKLSAP